MSLGIPERGMESVPGVKPPPPTDSAAVNRLLSPTKGSVFVLDKAQLREALALMETWDEKVVTSYPVVVEAARLVADPDTLVISRSEPLPKIVVIWVATQMQICNEHECGWSERATHLFTAGLDALLEGQPK